MKVLLDHALKANKRPISTIWSFKYKFDDKECLIKYRTHLCARGDLQHTEQDTFVATLAARIFRALMALIAAFDFEIRQYDAVNAFANSLIDESTYCKLIEGWTSSDMILRLLLRALYRLKQLPTLWYKYFSHILIKLELEPIAEMECLFSNDYLLLFFLLMILSLSMTINTLNRLMIFRPSFSMHIKCATLEKLSGF